MEVSIDLAEESEYIAQQYGYERMALDKLAKMASGMKWKRWVFVDD